MVRGFSKMRKIMVIFLVAGLLAGCTQWKIPVQTKQYQVTYLTLFDTVTTIMGYTQTEEEFKKIADTIYQEMENYHELFHIYEEYDRNNIKTINDNAGIAPVKVDRSIIELLLDCKAYYEETQGKVNVAMGGVLKLWHEAREKGIANQAQSMLPVESALRDASLHCNIEDIEIDEELSTVYIKDPKLQIDVGAVAKGWVTEKICQKVPEGFLVSIGGNVRVTGPKPEGADWVVGIQSPWKDTTEYVHSLHVKHESVVTSGDYQRYYVVDGKKYHHIIDPSTLFPGELWQSVSVICKDSGMADVLSTALFLLSKEEGQELLNQQEAYAMWIASKEEIYFSDGFEAFVKE